MSVENLAKVFGPTVVGYSVEKGDLQQCLNESTKQEIVSFWSQSLILIDRISVDFQVMTSLLNLPADYWSRLIDSDDMLPLIMDLNTPEGRPGENFNYSIKQAHRVHTYVIRFDIHSF